MVDDMKAAGINSMFCLSDAGLREIYFLTKDDPSFKFLPVTKEVAVVSVAADA